MNILLTTLLIVWILAALGYLGYIALKVREIVTRLTIIDIRLRVIEQLPSRPEVGEDSFWRISNALYKRETENLYVVIYEQIVRFARENDLKLPLKTLEEMKSLEKIKQKYPDFPAGD